MFKPYQTIMVLNMWHDGSRYDMRGTFIKEVSNGLNAGQIQVEVNTIKVHFPETQLMDFEEYFKIYNEDKTKLPSPATGKLNFLEGTYEGV